MGAYQRGAGAGGITGTVDVTGSSQFTAQCLFFDKNGGVKKIVRTGRGNTGIEQTRSGTEVATIMLRGKVIADGFPEPSNLRDASGTITFQFSTDPTGTVPLKIVYTVIFDGSTIKFNDKTEDGWDIQISATVTAYPTSSGWPGAQITPTPPVLSDIVTYEGLKKELDQNDLLTSAQRCSDVVNVADSDAAEAAKLAAMAAVAVTPMTGLKLRGINFERTDKLGGTVVEDWEKNDSVDDYQLPATYTVADASNLLSVASGGTIDGTPSTPSGYVLRTTKVITVKTGHTFTTREFGLRTTAEDIERPGTHTIVDPNALSSRARVAKVGGTPSLPVGFVERETDTYNENSLAQVKTIEGSLRSTKDDIQMPGTWTDVDATISPVDATHQIEGRGQKTTVYLTASGVPSDPSPPSGLQIVSSRISEENTLTSKKEWEFAVNSPVQKIILPASRSIRSPTDVFIDVVAGVFACSAGDPLAAIADAYFTIYQTSTSTATPFANTTTNLWSVEVERLTAVLVKVTLTYRNPGILVFSRSFGESVPVYIRDNAGSPEMYVSQVFTRGSTSYWLRLGEGRINQVVREFSLSRQYLGSTVLDFTSLENKTNAADFLGLSAGKVMYVGAQAQVNIGLSSTYTIAMTYIFRYCSNKFYTVADWTPFILSASNPGTGWVAAGSTVTTTTPSTGSFAPFLAAMP